MATPTAPEKLDGGATTVSWSGACAVIPTTVSAASCCTARWAAAARACAACAICSCRACSAAIIEAIWPLIEESSDCCCASFEAIACFAAARSATTRCWLALAVVSAARLRWTAFRNVCTWPSTFASRFVTLFALSRRLIMSSRLRAPRITSSVEVGSVVYSETSRAEIACWLWRRL